MPTVASVQAAITREGQLLTLKRIRAGNTPITVVVRGLVRGYAPHELVGNINQGDRRVIIGNAEISAAIWPGPPAKGDKLLLGEEGYSISGYAPEQCTVQAVNTILLRGAIAKHILTVRGS